MLKKIGLGLGTLWLVASIGSVFSQSNPLISKEEKKLLFASLKKTFGIESEHNHR